MWVLRSRVEGENMTQATLLAPDVSVAHAVNEVFGDVEAGFVNRHNEPAMTTPAVAYEAAVMVVAGSTICLIC